MRKLLQSVALLIACNQLANAQFAQYINQSSVMTENFNTLSASGTAQTILPAGWWIQEQGTSGNNTYRSGDGSSNTGDTYSFGTGTNADRALGSVSSGPVQANFGVRIFNGTGSSFNSFRVGLFMEQWRAGGRTGLDSLYFYYGIGSQFDSANTVNFNRPWIRSTIGDLVSKVTPVAGGGLDGNASANRYFYQFTITGITVNNNDTLFLRWQDPNVGGNDDGLSIDDFMFSVNGTVPVIWNSFTATKNDNNNTINFSTASEINNAYFEIERSNGETFESIGRIKAKGNSSNISNYQFIDNGFAYKTNYYRIKQVDMDGKFDYSKTIVVNNTPENKIISSPNPFTTELGITISSAKQVSASIELVDMLGKVHYYTSQPLQAGNNTIEINTINMPMGIYFVRVNNGTQVLTQKVIKK